MIDIIVARIKTGPITAVVPFGSAIPAGTYVVVKEEPTNLGYTRYRIIAHFAVGQSAAMRTYCKKTLYDLLAYQDLTGSSNRRFTLTPLGPGAVSNQNSDGTISQEALFRMPDIEYV
jgi:hypothetical protein